MIARIATLYVNYIEPGFKIFLIVAIIAFLLYGFNMVRGVDNKGNFVGGVVNAIVKITINTGLLVLKFVRFSFNMVLKTISMIVATVRDFLKSPI